MTDSFPDSNDAPLTDQDLADLKTLGGEKLDHTLLEMWRNVLSNVEEVATEKISPAVAHRVVSTWPKLAYQDVPEFFSVYNAKLVELRDILDDVIASDPGCLENIGDENDSDGVANRELYIELLFRWQERILVWDHAWDATAPSSHIEAAALADATTFFVGGTGLVAHLDQIQLQFTEDDRAAMGARLEAVKAAL